MAPIKFEETVKEKLEQRVIEPSSDAWKRLESKLDAQHSKKSNKTIWWIGIAASLTGVLLITNIFIKSQTDSLPNSSIVVDVENKTDTANQNQIVNQSNNKRQDEIIEDEVAIFNDENKQVAQKTSSSKKQDVIKLQQKKREIIAHNQDKSDSDTQIEKNEKASFKQDIDENKLEVVAQIQDSEKDNVPVLDSEIETLLKQAKKEVTAQSKNTNNIDANSLLQDVEADLEHSFRDKVFETLKTNFKKVKTAVADRNN